MLTFSVYGSEMVKNHSPNSVSAWSSFLPLIQQVFNRFTNAFLKRYYVTLKFHENFFAKKYRQINSQRNF